MLKIVLFLAGVLTGAAGAVSWLLSSGPTSGRAAKPEIVAAVPVSSGQGMQPLVEDLKVRWVDLKVRFQEAWLDGQRAGTDAEQRMRGELEAYRKGSGRSTAS